VPSQGGAGRVKCRLVQSGRPLASSASGGEPPASQSKAPNTTTGNASMFVLFKAFIVVITLAALVFIVAKPVFLRFMSPQDFALRRNLWLALTTAAFLLPDFWLFLLVATVLILYTAKRDSNPVALYMLLLITLPPLSKQVPTFGVINQLFQMNHLRFLSLVLLLPLALGYFRREPSAAGFTLIRERNSKLLLPDIFILLYVLMQFVTALPYESFTASGKRIIVVGVDTLLPYYVLSRACRTREQFREVMAAFVLAALVLVPLGVFESLRGWMLYAGIENHWGLTPFIQPLRRGAFLRAQLNSGHAIVLGFSLSIAVGFWLALQTQLSAARWRWAVLLSLLTCLLMTYSRGPWVGAAVAWVTYVVIGPNAGRRSVRALGLLLLVGIGASISPYSGTIVDNIPFVGQVGSGTILYRQRLAETSWLLVMQNPVFGSRNFLAYMEELRQGQGIIDLVNAYATIALGYGLVGLGLFLGFFATILLRCIKSIRQLSTVDPEFALTGAGQVAALVGALVMILTVNLYMSAGTLVWVLAGMGVAYARLATEVLANGLGVPVEPKASPARAPVQAGFKNVLRPH